MTKSERTEKLVILMLGIVFANVAHMKHFAQSETSYHALCGHFLRDSFQAGLGGGYRGMTRSLYLWYWKRQGREKKKKPRLLEKTHGSAYTATYGFRFRLL